MVGVSLLFTWWALVNLWASSSWTLRLGLSSSLDNSLPSWVWIMWNLVCSAHLHPNAKCLSKKKKKNDKPLVKFILKLPAPNRLPSGAISQRISCLYHEAFDDAVKNEIIIVAIPAVCCKVLHSFWTFLWVQSHVNITHCGMQNLGKQEMEQKR